MSVAREDLGEALLTAATVSKRHDDAALIDALRSLSNATESLAAVLDIRRGVSGRDSQ